MQQYSIQRAINDIIGFLKRFIYLENNNDYLIVAMYIILTYCPKTFNALPYLLVCGPQASGKTTLSEILHELCCNAKFASEISRAGIYRVLHKQMATLLIDEAEYLRQRKQHVYMNILRAGYRQSGRLTVADKKYDAIHYELFGPKVLVNIGGISDPALLSRCIKISMAPAKKI